jgi:hypothetical protein
VSFVAPFGFIIMKRLYNDFTQPLMLMHVFYADRFFQLNSELIFRNYAVFNNVVTLLVDRLLVIHEYEWE